MTEAVREGKVNRIPKRTLQNDDYSKILSPNELKYFKNQLRNLTEMLERMRLNDYISFLNRPGRLLWVNFAVGLARGLGVALGASILAGIVIAILKWLGVLNLPIIGNFIAELVEIVNSHVSR